MVNIFNKVVQYAVKLGPHVQKIEQNRERIYELSRELSAEEGYELIRLFDETVEQTKKLCEKRLKLEQQEED